MLHSLALVSTLAVSFASAHMQLQYPPPLRSKYDSQTAEADIDYSMSTPLFADGSNWMCKGYNTPEAYATLNPVATLKAGTPFDIQFAAGGATHLGGSCQFSVSYDEGNTFAVIYSIEGGCPLSLTYSVPIPSELPSSPKATFAWTWVSHVTREIYGNCAIVAIDGSNSAKSFTGPRPYRANALPDGTCISANNADTVFPNPGKYVEYGGIITASSPATVLSPCSYDEDVNVTVSPAISTGNGNGNGSSSTPSASSGSTATSSQTTQATSTAAATPTKMTATYLASSATSTKTQAPSVSSTARPKRLSYWQLVSIAEAASSASAAASKSSAAVSASTSVTVTSSASSVKATSSPAATSTSAQASASTPATPTGGSNSTAPASSDVYLKCLGSNAFALCAGGACTDMGSVAPGTVCRNNQIEMAPMKMKRMDKIVRRAASNLAHARTYEH